MADRFHAPNLDPERKTYLLEGSEAHHLLHVLRARVGTRVELFDGRGMRCDAEVVGTRKREVELALLDAAVSPPPPPLVLACAIPKGDRAQWLVEKCVELGVTSLIPLETVRSVVHPEAGKREKFSRIAIEACKQCRRDHLMTIEPTTKWSDVASSRSGWLLHPDGQFPRGDTSERPQTIAIGPEGGWTDDELQLARAAGWSVVKLPAYILRIETAALAATAIAQFLPLSEIS